MATDVEQLVIVGAGTAGCSAALAAIRAGLKVMLIDEHPQGSSAMSLDAPYFYGARLAPVLSDEGTVADRVLGSNDALMECLEAGVEVLVNTCVWGVFIPGPNSQHLGGRQLGLADNEKSWIVGFDNLILATGARDLVLSFPGWHLPGVLGAMGAANLLGKYQALGGERMLVLGSGNTALRLAAQALDSGVTIAGIVEPATEVQGDSALRQQLEEQGVAFFTGQTLVRALGVNEVSGAQLKSLGDGSEQSIPCDTICMAFGLVPNIELGAVAGCAHEFDTARSGWVPSLDEQMQTSVPGIFVIGDASGVSEAALVDEQVAVRQAQVAVAEIARREGLQAVDVPRTLSEPASASKPVYPPELWLQSLVAAGGMDVMVCQCEEVSRRELLEVRAPRYVCDGASSPANAVRTLVADGRASQDMLKRMTRVGMGHCQGRRCREHSAMLVANAAQLSLSSVTPGSYRVPVRPLPLTIMRAHDEPASIREHWPTWLHPVEGEVTGTH
ncbi:FAD-dependent oxidoreductase [Pseudomonas sp. ZM23]|uniref:FAD-dependent oxidoreductase n=1 Tax=Pseudomonas triclosanedens TaxID=2961893 RepID=A0ABY7A6I5_9PSED|nr:FAD-dependent oxidoreductase [Pseudomonas triclosanedens]MCP8465069.1 FAD-dependent oxidoreductase [Pseudomonas triclosanedens]MCP8470219.1 FAD-dependent oxidoreductase [Pseudomonas triclosanedens]MCP8476024.1 FAD-dependent oxidoreductase [Pseudomonas triclosanedens]WAI51738.1 FAD-dependent oxidoreductase [Pseudomonas triclosanedens]